MGNLIINFIAVFSGFITIITGYGLIASPKFVKSLGLPDNFLLILFLGSLFIACTSGGSSKDVQKIVKKQLQFFGKNNSQRMG